MRYDVTLSVWNKFFAPEQLAGFHRAGLKTFYIGNRRPTPGYTKAHRDYLSCAWLYATRWINAEFCRQASMWCFDAFAGLHRLDSKVLWAFCPMNTRLIKQAKRKNIPVVLDIAIGHQRLYQQIMREENKKQGLPFNEKLIEYWVRKYEWEYQNADWLTVGSGFVKKTLAERGIPEERIIVNNYGVDGAHWGACHAKRKELQTQTGNLPAKRPMRFAYIAGITSRKGLHYLVEAWRKAEMKNAELVIGGGSREAVVKLCGALPESVISAGKLTHGQLRELYSTVDVYVLPSMLEGLARSGVEAMAAGLPLLVTEESGLTDFCQHGKQGWVVPSRDVDALVERLRWCEEHPEDVARAGDEAFEIGKRQTFEAYGDRCAKIVIALRDGKDPREVEGISV